MTHQANEQSKVNILFLGTGAADWPENITDLKAYASKNVRFRRYSSALVNGRILIDCGPHVLDAFDAFGVNPIEITDILITHTHEDHLSPDILKELAAMHEEASPIRLWVHADGMERIPQMKGLELHALEGGVSLIIGDIGIKALEANHVVDETNEIPLHYLFSCEDKQWLYAADGAWFLKQAWLELRKSQLDAIILDATIGEIEDDRRIFDHNSLPMIRLMLSTFKRYGVLKEGSHILLTHMARTLHPAHDEVETALAPEGITPAYDGLLISF